MPGQLFHQEFIADEGGYVVQVLRCRLRQHHHRLKQPVNLVNSLHKHHSLIHESSRFNRAVPDDVVHSQDHLFHIAWPDTHLDFCFLWQLVEGNGCVAPYSEYAWLTKVQKNKKTTKKTPNQQLRTNTTITMSKNKGYKMEKQGKCSFTLYSLSSHKQEKKRRIMSIKQAVMLPSCPAHIDTI